ALRLEECGGELCRRPAAGVESIQLTGFRIVHDREQIAAHAVHHRLDDAHYSVGGDDGIDCVATVGEDRGAGLRGERTLGGNDAATAEDHRASLRSIL